MSDVLMLSAIVMLVLLFLKVPVYITVIFDFAMVYFVLNPDINAVVFAQQAIIGTEKISLMAIPFFICAGIFMNYTGVTKRIMDFCEVVTRPSPRRSCPGKRSPFHRYGRSVRLQHRRRGHEVPKMMVPEMTKKGFCLEFSSVVTAASSMITPLIPPGIAMILYGCIANVSIGKLFISGFGVGGLLASP